MIQRATLKVAGMSCGGCENAIKRVLKQVSGVQDVTASHTAGTVDISYDDDRTATAVFKQKIEALGYQVVQ